MKENQNKKQKQNKIMDKIAFVIKKKKNIQTKQSRQP